MSGSKQKAQRTCLGCQQVFDQDQLLRFVLTPERQVCPDLRRKLPGRGAYTCLQGSCINEAVRRKRFQRAFKTNDLLVGNELVQAVAAQLFDRILGLIGMGRKSGQIVSGSSMVLDALRHPEGVGLVLLADDASTGIADKVSGKAEDKGVPCFRIADKERLGEILGKEERSTLALKAGALAESLQTELLRYRHVVGDS